MTEFSKDLSKQFTGKEAIKERAEARLRHNISDIPYYDRGLDINEFTYGSKVFAIQQALRDFSPNVTIDTVNNRVQIYDIDIDIDTVLDNEE